MNKKYSLGDLSGPDGNAFFIMSKVCSFMRECGYSDADIKKYQNESMSGDYDHLVNIAYQMIDLLNNIALISKPSKLSLNDPDLE